MYYNSVGLLYLVTCMFVVCFLVCCIEFLCLLSFMFV